MKITLIAGARPNFMKVAAIIKAIKAHNEGLQVTGDGLRDANKRIEYRLVHTGQHYDKNMSDTFFEELGIPAPDVNLGCGGGSQAEQTAAIMMAFEKELMAHPTDVVLQEQGKELKSRSAQEIREYVLSASAQSKGRVLGDTSRSKKVLAEVLRIFDEILTECK